MTEKNYYIVASYNFIRANFEVKKIDITESPLSKSTDNLCFIIECMFHRYSNSKENSYYMNYLRNNKNMKIKDNTIQWEGIKCKIIELEDWKNINNSNFQGLVLKTIITDKLGNELNENFENSNHDGSAFKELFTYLAELNQCSTHKSVEIIRDKNKEIKLRNIIYDKQSKI